LGRGETATSITDMDTGRFDGKHAVTRTWTQTLTEDSKTGTLTLHALFLTKCREEKLLDQVRSMQGSGLQGESEKWRSRDKGVWYRSGRGYDVLEVTYDRVTEQSMLGALADQISACVSGAKNWIFPDAKDQ
jgi:hypothetical protein